MPNLTSITVLTLHCYWCGISLANATQVTYLNGNLPVCDLCLIKSGVKLNIKEE